MEVLCAHLATTIYVALTPCVCVCVCVCSVALGHLNDHENACKSYEQALTLDRSAPQHTTHTTDTTCTWNTHHLHTQHSPLAHTTSTYRENPLIHLNYAILLHNNGEMRAAAKQLQLFKSKSQTHTPSNTDPEVWNFISHATGLMYGMHFELNFIHVSGIQLELYVYTVTHIYTVCSCVFYR